MRIREARIRDAEAITNLISDTEDIALNTVMAMLQDSGKKVYVATDFSANILGCALDSEKIFVSSACHEAGVEDELKSKF